MDEAQRQLGTFGRNVVERAQRNLGSTRVVNGKKRRADSSGNLRKSLTFSYKDNNKGLIVLKFRAKGTASQYADVVEDGRRPGKFPPISAILQWMKVKPIRLRSLKTNSFEKVTPARLNSAAFLIARSIAKKGIKGLKYYQDAVEAELADGGDEMLNAVASDIVARITPDVR